MSDQQVKHIAIIMDGNGRWAKKQGLSRTEGHKAGAETVERVIRVCADENIRFLTLYAFSVENWKRPRLEVKALMELLDRFLNRKMKFLVEKGIRFNVIGRLEMFPEKLQDKLRQTMAQTAHAEGPVLTLALSYGGRTELVDAMKKIAQEVQSGALDPEMIDEQTIQSALYTYDLPDPEMLIRTSGELRLSNFLPWQTAYTEFFFTNTLWPDFSDQEFRDMIYAFNNRERRFGGVTEDA